MNQWKRSLVLMLTMLLMVALFLAACSKKNDDTNGSSPAVTPSATPSATTPSATTTASPQAADPNAPDELAKTWPEFAQHHEVKLLATEMGWTGPSADKDIVTPEIAKRTNLKINYEPLTVSSMDDLKQKLNLMVASNEVPDVFFGYPDSYSVSIYDRLGKAGRIWDLAPLLKDYKNLQTLLEPELNMYKDGEANYFLPTQTGRGNDVLHSAPGGLYIRQDWLDKLKLDYPKTPDDLYVYLKRVRDEIKDVNGKPVIPLTFGENFSGLEFTMFNPFYTLSTLPGVQGFDYDARDNYKIINEKYTDSPTLMRIAKFLNKLYQEKLIDQEVLIHKAAQVQEKLASGRVGASSGTPWDMSTITDIARKTIPDLTFVAQPPMYDKDNGVPKYPDLKWTNTIGMYSTLILSKKLDEATVRHFLAMLDYLATKDGQILVQFGIEGKTFAYDANGKVKNTDQFKTDTGNLDWNKQASYGVQYWAQLVSNLPAFDSVRAEYPDLLRPENKKSWDNQQSVRDRYDPNMKPDKSYYFVGGPIETRKMPAITNAFNEFMAKVLTAKSQADVEQLVHGWAKTAKNLGIDDIIKERETFIQNLKVQ